MHTGTIDRQAFELVAEAIESLDEYNNDRQLSFLLQAESTLQRALDRDPQYLDASFYSGVVKDLIGKPVEAVPLFNAILSGMPRDSEHRRSEVEYSRGVAWYHQYSHSKLAQAEIDFTGVLNRSADPDLRLLARAGLAQTYAMWMIPSSSQKSRLRQQSDPDVLDLIAEKRAQCLKQIDLVESERPHRPRLILSKTPASLLSGPTMGTILNAHGMCTMYWTDYNVTDLAARKELLQEAIRYLKEADKYLPGDWANTCDIGSAHLRTGVVNRQSGADPGVEFQTAIDLFHRVTAELRPNYGFALYERGRIYRVWGRFEEAKASLRDALRIPQAYRDVGDSNVKDELRRVAQGDLTFP
jgi:tetratricopeptide (TPR) repeat protein